MLASYVNYAGEHKAINFITENKRLKEELEKAIKKIQELAKVQESLGDLKKNMRGAQVSQTDFSLLNNMIAKNHTTARVDVSPIK